MKYNRFILPLLACAALSTACVDEIMEWQEPDQTVTEDDLPLSDDESMSLYKSIREYAEEYTPDMKIGLGLGADKYIEDAAYRALADEQFQMFTTGNAMKHSSVVKANGDLDFTTIDAFMQLVPSDIEVYGHNFLWHTQQKQQYLKSLIAPEMKVEVPQGEKCENVVTNGGFENGIEGWTGFWGKYTYAVEQPGHDSDNAIHFTISPECVNQWDAQLFWELGGEYLEAGVTYYYEFYVKSNSGLACQFIGNNTSNNGGIYKDTFTPGTDWTFCSGEFTYNEGDKPEIDKVGFQFGGEPGSEIWFDDFKFGKKIEEVEQEPMINIVTNSGFDDNTDGWISWNNHTKEIVAPGYEGAGALKLTVSSASANNYSDQMFWTLAEPLKAGVTYIYEYTAKTETPGTQVQFMYQSEDGSQQNWLETNELPSDWFTYTGEFTIKEEHDNITRIGIQFGGMESVLYIDNFKFGEKNPEYGKEGPADPDILRINRLTNGKFDADIEGWAKWNGEDGCNTWNSEEGNFEKGCLQVVNATDNDGGEWKLQIHANLSEPIPTETVFYVSYYIKTKEGVGSVRCSTTGNAHYQGNTEVTPVWTRVEWQVTAGGDVDGLNFDLGLLAGTYYIDDVVVSTDPFTSEPAAARRYKAPKMQKAAPVITYIYKTPEEKKALLLGAMESWIKQMAEHLPTVKYWDVINEPIMDGSNEWRGINNVFNGEDTAPVENEGLTLNWASDHWYWGYYIGQEYAVKAFEYARQYCGKDAKLFVNDYNLEVSPGKLNALIGFADYIDKNNSTGAPLVDGIGTQMHVSTSITKEQVDEMFKTMAATGKLVRVTELDVQVGTASPTADQLLAQAKTYKMIVESYKANVPAAQQSGITIWTLTDSADEHEFWLSDDAPNLFDANYGRKLAYKYFCDGLAGKDISSEFTGSEWKDLHATEEEPETENPETEETPAE